MRDKVRVGIIGCGSVARGHLQYLTSRNDVELVAVCDVIEARAKQYCTEFGANWYTQDYKNILSDDRINAVFILTPTGLHAEMVIAAAQSGKHIFCEKPMAMTVAECKAIRRAIEQTGVIFQIGYVLRFSSHILKLKEWLALIGRPALFRDMWSPSPWASPHPWVFDKNIGGGPLYEASHWIDLANFLFGRPKKVYATMHHFKPGGFTAPDTFVVIIDYEAGDCAVWSDTECVPGLDEFYIRHSTTRPTLSIIGPNGSIHFPSHDGSRVAALYLNHIGIQPVETHPWETDWGATGKAYQAELDYFLECVKKGQQPSVNTAEDGEWVIQVIEGALLSHKRGQPVQLPLMAWPVSSREWWDNYFASQWEANKGGEQTRHYMELILCHLPMPESMYLRSESLSILDWGCALGEGTDLLAVFAPNSRVIGLDFSPRAIEEARRRYPHAEFILTEKGEIPHAFDVIVVSHCLEHFENPLAKMKEHLAVCKDLYVVLVPYDEYPLPEYHRSQFREESFPERLGNFVRIHTQVITDSPYGKQLLIIYGSQSYLQKRLEVVPGIKSEREKWDRYYESLPLLEEDEPLKEFNKEFAEMVSKLLPPGSKILEAGSGAGWQSLALARLEKYSITLMDFSQEALKYARKLFEREGLQANFVYGNVFVPGEPEYDLVFNAGVLEHYTFDQQVAFLKGMASRSRRYVLVLVPNRQCYWYWLWRIQKLSKGEWPFGKEVPSVDLSNTFKAAGLQFVGQAPLGESWVESFINSLEGLDESTRAQILAIHRSPLIPKSQKSYLIAALGSVTPEVSAAPPGWEISPQQSSADVDELVAALGDALALRIGGERQLNQLRTQLAEQAQKVQALQKQLAERDEQLERIQADKATLEEQVGQLRTQLAEQAQRLREKQRLLDTIYTSRGFKLLAKIWEIRGAWRGGPRSFVRFIIRQVYRRLPMRSRNVLRTIYVRLVRTRAKIPTKPIIPNVKSSIGEGRAHFCSSYRIGYPGLVSVVLPVFNQASLLREAIQSVLNQTYENFELIIVNDGSTDDVETVLNEFVDHPKVRILTHKQNQGLPQALNSGFAYASGEFWTWTSADNLMMPQQLEKHVAFLQAHPEVAMVYSDYLAIDDRGRPLEDPRFRPHNRETPNSPVIRLPRSTAQLNVVKDNFIGPCFMYRGWVGRVLGPYDPDFMGCEDYDYWMRMNSHFKIAHLGTDELLYQYRVHDNTLNARAAELGIYERVDRLMALDQERRKFYELPFEIYADSQLCQELTGVAQCQPLSAVTNTARAQTKRLILLTDSDEALNALASLEFDKNDFIALLLTGEGENVYRIPRNLLQTIGIAFVKDKLALKRASILFKNVFLIHNVKELLSLTKIAANEEIFRRIQQKRVNVNVPCFYIPKGRKIKVILQVENFDKGGLEQVVYDLAVGLKSGEEFQPLILIVNRSGWFAHRARAAGVDVVELPTPFDQHAYLETIKRISPALINAHGTCFGADLAAQLNVPFIQTIHNTYVWLTPDKIAEYRDMEKYTTAYICVSHNVAKYSDLKMGLDPSRIKIIPNGINIERFDISIEERKTLRQKLRKCYNLSEEDFVFLCASAFFRHKGQLEAIEALQHALQRNQRLKLLFIGEKTVDFNYYKQVQQCVDTLGLRHRVVFEGFQEDPVAFYFAADAFIQPSYWEGWSLALAEALCAGLPVVVTDVGAAGELLAEGGMGVLVKPPFQDIIYLDSSNWSAYLMGKCGNRASYIQALAEAMLSCAQKAWSEYERVKSQRLIREKYTTKRMVSDYERLYLEVLTTPKLDPVQMKEKAQAR